MATCTYYAYNAPVDMTELDFEKMINEGATHVIKVSPQDSETVLTFEQPGYCAA